MADSRGSKALRVPVFVDEATGAERKSDVLLGGVPLPRGAIRGSGFYNLQGAGGRNYAVEGTPAAYWPDGSTKWLHLCGLVDLAGRRRNEFTLDLSSSLPAPEGLKAEFVQWVNAGGRVLKINGGPLEVYVNADVNNILAVRREGKACLITPGLSCKLVLVNGRGENRRELDLVFTEKEPQIVVQTANRVVVRLAGKFIQPSGREAGELVLFIEVLREVAEIRLQPVFIYLGNPQEDLVQALTLTVHTPISGEDVEYGLSNEQGRGYWDVIQPVKNSERGGGQGPVWPQIRQVQVGSSFYVTEKRTGDDSSWTKCLEGRRAMGWCHLKGNGRNLTAAMRYFWQEYPRSLTIDAHAGTVTFGLVPPEAQPLDLRRYSQTIYGAAVYEASSGPFPQTHGATGIAKASELMLRFDTTGKDDAPERGLFFVRPARPMVQPAFFAETGVLGQVALARADKHEAAEKRMAEITDFLINERDVRGWYGLMNFGDIEMGYYSDKDRWAFDDGGYAWVNTEHIPDYGLWIQAMRCGRADWLEAAVEMTRHNRDVDMYHRGLLKGMGTRHNVNHWGCQDKEWRVSMPLVKRLHYYMTGDPWTKEVILGTVDVYQRYERVQKIAPGEVGVFAGILARWEMDHSEADERTLSRFADGIAAAVREDGLFTNDIHLNAVTGESYPVGDKPFTEHFFMNGFGPQHTLVEYAELTGHEKLTKALVKHAGYYTAEERQLPDADHKYRGVGSAMVFLAHAWRQTHDERYRQAIAQHLEDPSWLKFEQIGGEGILAEPVHQRLADMKRWNKVACSLGGILHQWAYGLHVL